MPKRSVKKSTRIAAIPELIEYLKTRDFNISYNEKNGELEFSLENVQEHLRSQYFI